MPDWTIYVIIGVALIFVAAMAVICLSLRRHTITFDTGKIKFDGIESIKCRSGKDIALPILVAEKCEFTGWYYDAKRTKPADIHKMPSKNITLYAGWRKKKEERKSMPNAQYMDISEAIATNLEFGVELEW